MLPSELVPLYIFEERYQELIDYCIDEESEFGVAWSSGSELKAVGCSCVIIESLGAAGYGRMNIMARGDKPFRIVHDQQLHAYPSGTVEFLEDRPELIDHNVLEAAAPTYADVVEQATERRLDADALSELSSYEMAATIDFAAETKQSLLDLRSETARLRLLTRLFLAASKQLELVERAQRRADERQGALRLARGNVQPTSIAPPDRKVRQRRQLPLRPTAKLRQRRQLPLRPTAKRQRRQLPLRPTAKFAPAAPSLLLTLRRRAHSPAPTSLGGSAA